MRFVAFCVGLTTLVAFQTAQAQTITANPSGPNCLPPTFAPNCPPGAAPSAPPNMTPNTNPTPTPMDSNIPNAPAPAAAPDSFAGATETGTQPGASFNPNMFGDLIGLSGQQRVTIPGQYITINTPQGATGVVRTLVPYQTIARGVPIVGQYTGFKVSDNESPRPVDRVFFTYHEYSDVNRSQLPSGIPNLNVQQQLIGFEKTFLEGNASAGMRLPFAQLNGFSDVQSNVVGDLTLTSKFAWINNQETRNVFSTGMLLTVPTGGGTTVQADGSKAPHSTLFQPWLGYIYNVNRAYVQGFSSIVAPSDARDPTIMFNSIGAGYWAYRSEGKSLLSALIPVAELHLNTPFDHRNADTSTIYFKDQLNATGGVYAIFGRAILGGAVGLPLVGPRPYSVEAIASLNIWF